LPGAVKLFPEAGLAVAHAGSHLLACAPGLGGAFKLWQAETGQLIGEEAGYLVREGATSFTSQTGSRFNQRDEATALLALTVEAGFDSIPSTRFDPWRFMAFRLFMLTVGRLPAVAQAIKSLLVRVLIRKRRAHPARLRRRLSLLRDGRLLVDDQIANCEAACLPVARQVPIHMGSARYGDLTDWMSVPPRREALRQDGQGFTRRLEFPPPASNLQDLPERS
jgi:hypothetical protein